MFSNVAVGLVVIVVVAHLSAGGHLRHVSGNGRRLQSVTRFDGRGYHDGGRYEASHGGGASGAIYGPARPYDFSYSAQDVEGSHSHSQSSDGHTVRGHYLIQLADGHMRRVEYHADETGFHARIVTNELGTESKNAADAVFESSALSGPEAAIQYGPVRSAAVSPAYGLRPQDSSRYQQQHNVVRAHKGAAGIGQRGHW